LLRPYIDKPVHESCHKSIAPPPIILTVITENRFFKSPGMSRRERLTLDENFSSASSTLGIFLLRDIL
jgi:hypothetical protein